jgi:hypothetical protein
VVRRTAWIKAHRQECRCHRHELTDLQELSEPCR